MSIWRTVHVKNNNKVEKFHETEENAQTYLKQQIAVELFAPVLSKGLNNELRLQRLVDLIPEYEIKIAGIDEFIEEFKPAK